jgi:hypothetical protein
MLLFLQGFVSPQEEGRHRCLQEGRGQRSGQAGDQGRFRNIGVARSHYMCLVS